MCEWIELADDGSRLYCEIPWSSGFSPGSRAGRRPRAGISLGRAGDMDLQGCRTLPWRSTLCAELGFDEARVRAVRQTHSRKVVRVDGQDHESLAAMDADGMVTARADLLLTVTVADCLPIFLWDRRTSAVGLVHSGWKGTGIAAEAIGLMAREFGTLSGDLAVAIGPGIGPCCYDVPRERFESFKERFGESCVARDSKGSFRLDLKRANIELLEREGVRDISAARDCTCCSAGLGSFRRQGAGGFTRMLAFIGWF